MWLRLLSLQEFVWCSRPQGQRRLNPTLASNALLHAICIFSCTARVFLVAVVLSLLFLKVKPSPTWALRLDLGLVLMACSLLGTMRLCSHKGFFGEEQGKVGWWLSKSSSSKQELYWTCTLIGLYHGWCLNLPLPCAVWPQSSSFISRSDALCNTTALIQFWFDPKSCMF